MKFAHIADLHIGKRVNDFSMLEEQRYIFKEIIENNENYVDSNNKWKNIDPARLVERWFRIDL